MNSFDRVTERWGKLPYMKEDRGRYIRDFMLERSLFDVIEIGFFHGKSSAYFAAIREHHIEPRINRDCFIDDSCRG